MPKRVKHHDRDKYYHLAKDQGYRARSAFKLIQINRKHDILSKAKVCIDLCAAPGGWLQVAAQVMPSQSIILGVDLLPIRPIPNVKTFVADITTGECRDRVRKELQGWKADVVLCDGAPNVGAAYVKDAYVQNELVLAALKTATDHLMRNGTFCTKVYRSQDYNKLLWVLNQLFTQVIAIKPSSSRSQSAEIFMLCKGYVAPDRIDPRILDPAHVFAMVEGEQGGPTGVTIFSKSFDASHRRRQGYGDATNPTLRSFLGASEFIDSKDPVQALTDATEIRFEGEADDRLRADACTTEEVLEACADLRVLGKADFKMLLKWRLKVRKARAAEEEAAEPSAAEAEPEAPVDTEEAIQQEIAGLYDQMARKRKREKKKVREKAAKLRERKAYGMDNNAFEVQEHDSMFNLASAGSQQLDPLEAMSRMELLMEDEDEARARRIPSSRGRRCASSAPPARSWTTWRMSWRARTRSASPSRRPRRRSWSAPSRTSRSRSGTSAATRRRRSSLGSARWRTPCSTTATWTSTTSASPATTAKTTTATATTTSSTTRRTVACATRWPSAAAASCARRS